MSSGSGLSPKDHAAFAVLSRLVSCLVTEGILSSKYLPWTTNTGSGGVLVVLSALQPNNSFTSRNILLAVPLHHHPVLKSPLRLDGTWHAVALVDPLDMLPDTYELTEEDEADRAGDKTFDLITDVILSLHGQDKGLRLRRLNNPVLAWEKIKGTLRLPLEIQESMTKELQSSLDWQALAYERPPPCPSLASPAIVWEQSLVAGHPTHPMHRARSLENCGLDYDWYHPIIRFVRVQRDRLVLHGGLAKHGYHLAVSAALRNGKTLIDGDDYAYIPVHELQIPNIRSKFPDVEILAEEISLRAYAQSSIRTVTIPELPGYSVKLAVGVKISSALRTISHFTADFGPRFSTEVVPRLAVNQDILAIELETSSAIYCSDDPDLAKHLTVVLREDYSKPEGEVLIVVASLLESDLAGMPSGIPVVQHVFGLDTEEKRINFLDRYVQIACAALLPALLKNGVAFEAHAQNMVARFDRQTGVLKGFVYRDLGGMRIHPPTLKESIGVEFQFLPHHCVATSTIEEIYPKFYHTFVHNHIQRFIRVLDLHYNGKGWEILRHHMHEQVPKDHPVFQLWLNPESMVVQSKGLLRMRMQDSYRDMVYCAYPNMIQYRPVDSTTTLSVYQTSSLFDYYVSCITGLLKRFSRYLYTYV